MILIVYRGQANIKAAFSELLRGRQLTNNRGLSALSKNDSKTMSLLASTVGIKLIWCTKDKAGVHESPYIDHNQLCLWCSAPKPTGSC